MTGATIRDHGGGHLNLPLLVLGDPVLLRHMAGVGHYVRFVFRDGTTAISGPYARETAHRLAQTYSSLGGLLEIPDVSPAFEPLAEDVEPQPGRRWWWLGRRGDVRVLRGPFGSRREARTTVLRVLDEAGRDPGVWTATYHYSHDPGAYRRTRRNR